MLGGPIIAAPGEIIERCSARGDHVILFLSENVIWAWETGLVRLDDGDHPTSAYPAERLVTLVDRRLRAPDWAVVSHSESPPTR